MGSRLGYIRIFLAAAYWHSLITGSSGSIDPGTLARVNAACGACDADFLSKIDEYQLNYGQWPQSIQAAGYYCSQFGRTAQCYVSCVQGTTLTYLTSAKKAFDSFYSENCDPVCYNTVIPWCYRKYIGQYSLDLSCDANYPVINEQLRVCLLTELFIKQNCSGMCTPGQRRANFFLMQLQSQCLVPLNAQDLCFSWVQYCIESYYGDFGSAYISYNNAAFIQSNSLSCRYYGDGFASCIQRSINENVMLGVKPDITTYRKPCANYQDQINFLQDYEYSQLVSEVCNDTLATFADICSPDLASSLSTVITSYNPTTPSAAAPAALVTASTLVILSSYVSSIVTSSAVTMLPPSLPGLGLALSSQPVLLTLTTTPDNSASPPLPSLVSSGSFSFPQASTLVTVLPSSITDPLNATQQDQVSFVNQSIISTISATSIQPYLSLAANQSNDTFPDDFTTAALSQVQQQSTTSINPTTLETTSPKISLTAKAVAVTTKKSLFSGFLNIPLTTPAPSTTTPKRKAVSLGFGFAFTVAKKTTVAPNPNDIGSSDEFQQVTDAADPTGIFPGTTRRSIAPALRRYLGSLDDQSSGMSIRACKALLSLLLMLLFHA